MKEIPYIVFESEMVRLERFIKKLFILIVTLIVLLFGTNIYWIYYESQFEEVVTTEVTQDNTDGYHNYVGNDGDITNGETNSKDN